MHQPAELPAAMNFLAALGRLDFDAAGLLLDKDAVFELPFAGKGVTVKGREEIVRFLRSSMTGKVGQIEYKLDRAYPVSEPGVVVLEISTQGRTAAGKDYTNRLVAIFEFRDGRIALFREYFNPAPVSG